MTWADLTRDWCTSYADMKTTFPRLEDEAMAFMKQDRQRFIGYIATSHSLTYQEAEDALDDYLMMRARDLAAAPSRISA